MSNWLDIKYVNMLSGQLRNFKRKGGNLFQMSCPFCGDSQKQKSKARGYVFSTPKGLLYHCHNCSLTVNIPRLLKYVSPTLHEEYVKELMVDKYQPKKDRTEEFTKQVKKTITPWINKDKLQKVSELADTHPCKQYVVHRKLPYQWHTRLFYVPKFMEWTNGLLPGKFSDNALKHDEGRLVIPFLSKDKNIFGYQGRALEETVDNKDHRYYTIMLNDSHPKVFGLDTVDFDRTFYVFEGPIDAMFIPNSIAVAGGSLYECGNNGVMVFDNEPRSAETCKKIHKAIMLGYKVCIWPDSVTEKDVNEIAMKMDGVDTQFIKRMIDHSTFSGLSAQLAFHGWKKI